MNLLHDDKVQTSSKADLLRTDMVEYFTLWAHQIKTPIAAMYLLLQTDENEQNSELAMELFKIEQYVEMVLQYLRLDHMTSDFVLKRYSLDDMVKQAVRKYAKMFIRKKIKLSFINLNCDVLTDEKWLVFVLEQILSNAIKYSHKGQISIYMDPRRKKHWSSKIQESGSHRKICPVCLKKDIPAIMAVLTKNQQELVCTFASRFYPSYPTPSKWNLR